MVLIILTGRSATGKSALAAALARKLAAVVISTDTVRQELRGKYEFPESEREKVTSVVYGEMFKRAKKAFAAGKSVILDGTFYSKRLRSEARNLSNGSLLVSVVCSVEKRKERSFKVGLPEEVYEEPEDADVVVDTEKLSVEQAAEKVLAALKR
jgi:predicted kinase